MLLALRSTISSKPIANISIGVSRSDVGFNNSGIIKLEQKRHTTNNGYYNKEANIH